MINVSVTMNKKWNKYRVSAKIKPGLINFYSKIRIRDYFRGCLIFLFHNNLHSFILNIYPSIHIYKNLHLLMDKSLHLFNSIRIIFFFHFCFCSSFNCPLYNWNSDVFVYALHLSVSLVMVCVGNLIMHSLAICIFFNSNMF